jgi:hypothetical protein
VLNTNAVNCADPPQETIKINKAKPHNNWIERKIQPKLLLELWNSYATNHTPLNNKKKSMPHKTVITMTPKNQRQYIIYDKRSLFHIYFKHLNKGSWWARKANVLGQT